MHLGTKKQYVHPCICVRADVSLHIENWFLSEIWSPLHTLKPKCMAKSYRPRCIQSHSWWSFLREAVVHFKEDGVRSYQMICWWFVVWDDTIHATIYQHNHQSSMALGEAWLAAKQAKLSAAEICPMNWGITALQKVYSNILLCDVEGYVHINKKHSNYIILVQARVYSQLLIELQ